MSKECPICHASVEDTAAFCPVCGATLSTEMGWEDPVYWTNPTPARTDGYPSSTAKGLSIAVAVCCFISAGATVLLLLLVASIGSMMGELGLLEEFGGALAMLSLYFWPMVLLSIADAVFYTVFGILLLIKKSWKIALTITIYSGVWFLLGMINNASAGIPLLLVLGILCTIWLRKASGTPGKFM